MTESTTERIMVEAVVTSNSDGLLTVTLTHPLGFTAEVRLDMAVATAEENEPELDAFMDHLSDLFAEAMDSAIGAAEAAIEAGTDVLTALNNSRESEE